MSLVIDAKDYNAVFVTAIFFDGLGKTPHKLWKFIKRNLSGYVPLH
jgi:hypothetical protein